MKHSMHNLMIISLLVMLFGMSKIVLAEADGPDFYAVTGVAANDVLNIRTEPDAKARKIGSIPHDGRGLRNLGCEGGPSFAEWQQMNEAEREAAKRKRWCRIEYQGTEGWVAGWYLMEDSNSPTISSQAAGAGPSFDCAKVENGSMAAIVCQDARLAALDRELTRLYQLAVASVAGARHDELVGMQRGWIKGRDECWKEQDKPNCIAFNYVDRIGELRQAYAAARAEDAAGISRGPIPFACGDGVPVSLTFIEAEPPLANLTRLQDSYLLERQPTGSGAKYAGGNIEFSINGEQALLTLPVGNETNCNEDVSD